jgi:hypothetical protein
MFQIAFAYSLSKKLGIDYAVSTEKWGCEQGSHPSKYFNNLFERVNIVENLPDTLILNEKTMEFYNILEEVQHLLTQVDVLKMDGYFQSEKYFYGVDVRSLFRPREELYVPIFEKYPELKETSDRALICVRRGFFLTIPGLACELEYFKKAMDMVPAEKYYVRSDDPEWVKENFKDCVCIDTKDDLEAFLITTLFPKYIISDSTYYWWGSYLSVYDNPTIIAPLKWGSYITRDCFKCI